MKQGIVLIALGHNGYGRMAYNLALTLKRSQPDCQITLLHDVSALSHLSQLQRDIFDGVVLLEDPAYWTANNEVNYTFVKLWLDTLSPYEETLFIDVDMAWCSKFPVSALFKSLKKQNLLIKNRSFVDLYEDIPQDAEFDFWAHPSAVQKEYGHMKGRFYQLHLEFMYFKKTEETLAIFETARDIAQHPKVKCDLMWAGKENADELPMAIALAIHNHKMRSPFNPAHWGYHDGFNVTRSKIIEDFYLLSTGGKEYNRRFKAFYNDLVNAASVILKMPKGFAHADKKTYLPERSKI